MSTDAMRAALAVLEQTDRRRAYVQGTHDAIDMLRAALAQPARAERVPLTDEQIDALRIVLRHYGDDRRVSCLRELLSRQSKPLTQEQVVVGFGQDSHESFCDFLAGARFAERAHGIVEPK